VGAANFGSQANYLQQTSTPSDTNGFHLRFDRTITSKQSMFVRWSWKKLIAQSLTDTALGTVNNFLPPDQDTEHNNNLIISHNFLITNNLVNEVRFGLSLWQLQVKFPIQCDLDFGPDRTGSQRPSDGRRVPNLQFQR
jgi:hypothetical protein